LGFDRFLKTHRSRPFRVRTLAVKPNAGKKTSGTQSRDRSGRPVPLAHFHFRLWMRSSGHRRGRRLQGTTSGASRRKPRRPTPGPGRSRRPPACGSAAASRSWTAIGRARLRASGPGAHDRPESTLPRQAPFLADCRHWTPSGRLDLARVMHGPANNAICRCFESGRQDFEPATARPPAGRFHARPRGFGWLELVGVVLSWGQLRSIWTPDWTPSEPPPAKHARSILSEGSRCLLGASGVAASLTAPVRPTAAPWPA
jgi:hypothetical protein